MKVFFDTNVWVSAFIGSSLCGDLIADCLHGHEVLTSALVGAEIVDVLERKTGLSPEERRQALALIGFACSVKDAPAAAGDNDARLLEAAWAAGADLFVTGDKAVLERRSIEQLRIVSPREAWAILFVP